MDFRKKLAIFLVVVLSVVVTVRVSGASEFLTVEYLKLILEKNLFVAVGIFVGLFVIANLLYIPGFIFLLAPVLVLGKQKAFFLMFFTGSISCLVSYFLIGYFGKNLLRNFKNQYAQKAFDRLDKRPLQSIFILRLLMQTNPALNYSLAMSGVRFRDYMLGSLLGLPIPIAIYCLTFEFFASFLI
ncbi:hypothetical protein A9Q84_04465 [Halobacteriovorax marinus]|mgnify:CR=1 FL=1|uniref:TVP38/TMEM64 family membrane protein n=1 Tax=Halobacteriovorax marinus TaxID=97084 RepID=A0A1Y5FG81_9BACT|nr:hypothetical protein A9Q84_04465 [Halobacteriovorax marinus]